MHVITNIEEGIRNGLTPREQQVLASAAEGHPAKVIADLLHMSRYTAESHLKRIRTWADGKNTAFAITKAYALDILRVTLSAFMAVLLSWQSLNGAVDMRRGPRTGTRSSATRLARRRNGSMVAMFGNDPYEGALSLHTNNQQPPAENLLHTEQGQYA